MSGHIRPCQDDLWLSGQWYAGGIYAEEELVTTLSLSTFAAWQEGLFVVLGSGNMKHFFISFKYFSNIHIFMNNSQDQMRCLWTTQEDIYIYMEDNSFFFRDIFWTFKKYEKATSKIAL